MAQVTIEQLLEEDLEEFVNCQFKAFVGNSLHDVVYPDHESAVRAHRDAIDEGTRQQAGNKILYLKAVDDDTGRLIGGIKCCYHAGSAVAQTSPYSEAIPKVDITAPEDVQYRCYVMREVLERRVQEIQGPHALVDLLFVHPDSNRRGIGQQLVARACSVADERGLRFIVEASPAGKRTYELCGFVSKQAVSVEPGRWADKPVQLYFWMEREPCGASSMAKGA